MSDLKEHIKKGVKTATVVTDALSPHKTAIKGVKKLAKKVKQHIDTKKGNFPETESLTHQKGPYVGDVGSEKRPKGGWTS